MHAARAGWQSSKLRPYVDFRAGTAKEMGLLLGWALSNNGAETRPSWPFVVAMVTFLLCYTVARLACGMHQPHLTAPPSMQRESSMIRPYLWQNGRKDAHQSHAQRIHMTHLHLALLGQPRIYLDDASTPIIIPEKQLALLAYLALTNETFARAQLEALLWGDASAEKAQTSLRTAIYNLNKRLNAPLQTSRKAVWFAPEQPHRLDSAEFAQLIAQGDVDSLKTAVALYRGDLLAGLTVADAPEFEMWLLQARERYRLDLLTALEQLIDHALAAGDVDDAIDQCRRLLQIEPWRESVHRQLMRLLARSGDLNAAIRQYTQCRDMLATELDVAPMPETDALYTRILALRERPPARPLPTPPPLLGRDEELAQLTAKLADPTCRLIAITGMGGIGKTSLALTLAAQQTRLFLEGVSFVRLSDLESPTLLDTAVAEALAIAIPPGVAPRQALLDALQPQERLLVLDDVDALLTPVTELVQALLTAAPELTIVLTSREAPRLRSAWRLPLTGLPLPNEEANSAEIPSPALTLFDQQARHVQPDFNLDQWRPHAMALCRLLQGSPLGIELAAAQLDLIDCAELAERVASASAELAVDFADVPPRHRSLRALFEHSWQLLTPTEQTALARLAVFRGGFTAETATAVADVAPSTLRALLAKSLLQRSDDRFALHALIRQFALEHLPLDSAVFAQHARTFSQLLASRSEGAPAEMVALLPELDNIRAMWQFALRQEDAELLFEAAHGLARLYAVTNQFAEGRVLFDEAVARWQTSAEVEHSPLVWGTLLGRAAMFRFRTGDLPAARQTAARSVAVLEDAASNAQGDPLELAFSLNLLATLHIHAGAFDEAVPLLTACADVYRREAHPGLLKPLINLSSVYMRQGDYAAAIAQLNEALPLAETLGDQRAMAHILNNLGANYLMLGKVDAAQEAFTACLTVTEATGYQSVRMVVHQNLAEVAYKRGDWATAIAESEAGLAISAEIGDRVQQIRIEKMQALALFAAGRQTQAWQVLRQAVEIGFSAEALPALMDVLSGVATLLLAEQRPDAAVPLLQAIAAHPATEQQYVTEARDALAELGIDVDEAAGSRPLAEVVADARAAMADA